MHRILPLTAIATVLSSCAIDNSDRALRELKVTRIVDLQDDSETVTADSQGHHFKATVQLRPFTKQDVQDHRYWFGVDGDLPERVVKSIRVERDGYVLPIPDQVYSDLGAIPCEPQQWLLRLFVEGDRLLVLYAGSDGAGSYESKFYFTDRSFDHALIRGGAREVVRHQDP